MKMLALAIVLLSFPWLSHAQSNKYGHNNGHNYGYSKNHYFWQDVESREYKQQRKINKGIEKGMLTRKEVKKLRREHKHVDKQIRHLKHQHYLSRNDRKNVMRHLDHYSELIRHLKHNDRYAHRHNHNQYSHYNNRRQYKNDRHHISSAKNDYSFGFQYRY